MKFDIWMKILRKSAYKIQILLQPDKNKGYVALKPIWAYDNISSNGKYFKQSYGEKPKYIFLFNTFFSDNPDSLGYSGKLVEKSTKLIYLVLLYVRQ